MWSDAWSWRPTGPEGERDARLIGDIVIAEGFGLRFGHGRSWFGTREGARGRRICADVGGLDVVLLRGLWRRRWFQGGRVMDERAVR